MARLAIRATSDTSKREKVTTGRDTISVNVYSGNKHTFTILLHHDGTEMNIYDEGSVYTYDNEPTYDTIHFIKQTKL